MTIATVDFYLQADIHIEKKLLITPNVFNLVMLKIKKHMEIKDELLLFDHIP